MSVITVDARGEQCPVPVVKTRKALEANPQEEGLVVLVSELNAAQNVQRMAKTRGCDASIVPVDDYYSVRIAIKHGGNEKEGLPSVPVGVSSVVAGLPSVPAGLSNATSGMSSATSGMSSATGEFAADGLVCPVQPGSHIVVAIGSATMGEGDPKLGQVLMKGFIYGLAQQENLPECVLFYNGGAQYTCEGSVSLEDIKSLADRGVEILTCGTCLDYYQLKDKLAVGQVTNMYAIVEKMMGATQLVKP